MSEGIYTKEELKEWLRYEHELYKGSRGLKYILQYSEGAVLWRYQKLLRKTEYYRNTGKKIRGWLCNFRRARMQNKYGIHISPNTCGKGLHIMHIGPVIVNSKAKVGENCTFHVNTAVVAGGTNDDVPVIGNRVILGIGAVVLGKVTVANGVAIGANAVVNKSVEEESIAVAGVPAKKVSNNGSNRWNVKKTESI